MITPNSPYATKEIQFPNAAVLKQKLQAFPEAKINVKISEITKRNFSEQKLTAGSIADVDLSSELASRLANRVFLYPGETKSQILNVAGYLDMREGRDALLDQIERLNVKLEDINRL